MKKYLLCSLLVLFSASCFGDTYEVIVATSISELEESVDRMLENGYICQGGFARDHYRFFQAMIKENEEKKNDKHHAALNDLIRYSDSIIAEEKEEKEKKTSICSNLNSLAGKLIYRDKYANNGTEYSEDVELKIPYKLIFFNEAVITVRKYGDSKTLVLDRSLWDDGNWKECVEEKKTKVVISNIKDEVDKFLITKGYYRQDCPTELLYKAVPTTIGSPEYIIKKSGDDTYKIYIREVIPIASLLCDLSFDNLSFFVLKQNLEILEKKLLEAWEKINW